MKLHSSYLEHLLLMVLVSATCTCADAAAFIVTTTAALSSAPPPATTINVHGNKNVGKTTNRYRKHQPTSSSSSKTMLQMSSPGGDNEQNNPASELTSTLARLDQQWKIQQANKPVSRWTKLQLKKKNEEEDADDGTVSSSYIDNDYVYLLEPPNQTRPSCIVTFLGGAGLGTYPNIAYNEFLLRISDKLNAAILTAPYQVGLDHFALSKESGERIRRAILQCQEDEKYLYDEQLPLYSLSHSLGCKLSCIYVSATSQKFNGIGYISFNNFSFSRTIGMAKNFAETIRESTGMMKGIPNNNEIFDNLFNLAEMAVGMTGIDFSPTQAEMERLMKLRYPRYVHKTRFFTFDQDVLENTQEVCDLFQNDDGNGESPSVSGLPGTHLTPVYFKLGLDELPEESRQMASDAMGGFQSVSYGNKEELDVLVNEVCDWVLGKPPSQKPAWMRDRPQIAAATATARSAEDEEGQSNA